MVKYIDTYIGEEALLEVYECECGFYIGLDVTFLDQVGDIDWRCPACERVHKVKGADDD